MKIEFHFFIFLYVFILMACVGCHENESEKHAQQEQSKTGPQQLDRSLAETIINPSLKPMVQDTTGDPVVIFSTRGFKWALSEQLVTLRYEGRTDPANFTEKGKGILRGLYKPYDPEATDAAIWIQDPMGYSSYRNFYHNNVFKSLIPISQVVESIDGIADLGNGEKLVEFSTKLIYPETIRDAARRYFIGGALGSATLLLYDDGWRVKKIDYKNYWVYTNP
jgi:hypothetical protein